MANRLYLYAADTLPDSKGLKPDNLIGVCEFNYDYSYSSLILVGAKPLGIFPSVLWKNSLLIAGDFEKGTELFTKFLTKAQQLGAVNNEYLTVNSQKVITYLKNNKRKYFLLEFSELMEMDYDMEDMKEIQTYAENLAVDAEIYAKTEVPRLLESDTWTPAFKDIPKDILNSRLDLYFTPNLYFDVCAD
ncbi:hypothetical protein A3K02_02285 [candidate division WS6 bacterium RIFOXYD1_FULL_33_8]|nr:MAG: hypothetical protein A2369_03075 [candidate division WS6 bacterium RIFOXYB1_FULL_33_15]OGC42084.1 MAG: hypothetical protein A3K02_02285 [candidate division WS6 bacterium RIFOXYD1_FULL_33_8]